MFGNTSSFCELHRWIFNLKDPNCRLLFCLGVILVHVCFVPYYDVPDSMEPLSVKSPEHTMAPNHPTLFPFFAKVMGHLTGKTVSSLRQYWKMAHGPPDEICMISCIPTYASLGSSSVRDSTLETFCGVPDVGIRPQRSPSSNDV